MLATTQFRILSSFLLSKNSKIKIYKAIISPSVVYMCETLSLTLQEEHRLRVFENSVMVRISGPMREEMVGGWRRLQYGRKVWAGCIWLRTGTSGRQALVNMVMELWFP
jgi:hypothetical protein